MYQYRDIKTVHLEITSKCNARCPMCLRTVCGGINNPQLPLVELNLDEIQNIFTPSFIQQLDQMYMCGNYGDPIIAIETLETFQHFREINPEIHLSMFTNASARDEDWWQSLAKIVNVVHFSVDGLEGTNHIYRKGTHFPSILRNMKAYLNAGGEAVWDYIIFKHNEHQVEEARTLSQELGFKKFNIKKTGRFFNNILMESKDRQEVFNRQGNLDYYIEKPSDKKYHNAALTKEDELIEKYGSLESYFDKTSIHCKVASEKSLYVSAMGRAFPCCWTANQLYPWYYKAEESYMWKLVNQLENGIDDLDVKKNSLESVVNGDFFQNILLKSWEEKSLKNGKPRCCAKICGSKFDPFGSQFSNSEQISFLKKSTDCIV